MYISYVEIGHSPKPLGGKSIRIIVNLDIYRVLKYSIYSHLVKRLELSKLRIKKVMGL